MDELKNPEEQVVSTPAQEEVQSSSVGAEEPQAETLEEGQSAQSAENIKSLEGEKKPKSRLEQRIEDLEGKLATAATDEDKQKISSLIDRLKSRLQPRGFPPTYQTEPLIKPEDLETGVDPEELERRQLMRELALKSQIKAELEQEEQFKNKVREHIADNENVISQVEELNPKSDKYDKDLDVFISKQYWLANNVFNPLTGEYEFIPTVKMSNIVAEFKKVIDKKVTIAQAETQAQIRNDVSSSAIPPSTAKESSKDFEDDALLEKAKETGDEKDWAEVIKRRLNLKI